VPEPHWLRDWMEMPLGANMLPWLKGKELARLERMVEYFLLNSKICRRSKTSSRLGQVVQSVIRSPIRWRLNSNRGEFPWELWLAGLSERWASRRSLITGQELPKLPASAC
jgi:anaerobic magnesium-protoporphyrin IX monomethyl ester cyclase